MRQYSPMGMPSAFGISPGRALNRERGMAVGMSLLVHASVFAGYLLQPEAPTVLVNEISISFTNAQMPQRELAPQPKPIQRESEPVPADEPAPKETAQPVQQTEALPSPVQLDAEPDYRADYLNNLRPPYPMVARRMGYHGKVVLDVEVLAEGRAGDVQVHQSSGFTILDNAALQTVKTWRFTPAKRFGQAVTKRFLVPIKFSLEGNEA